MNEQFINTQSALIVTAINLKEIGDYTEPYKAIALPSGAELIALNLEIVEPSNSDVVTTINLDDEANFFSGSLALSSKRNFEISKVTTINQSGFICLKLNKVATQGLIKLRAHFYYPSQRSYSI